MHVIQIAPSTGSFYCGTCMRENALVAELRRQGHYARMVPLYLPLMVDEPPTTGDTPLFYGGVNVYLQQKSALFRKSPRWLDRFLDAPSVLQLAASPAGSTAARALRDLQLSPLRGAEGPQ